MVEFPRLFTSADTIRTIGEAMLACGLARADWTHEAHLSTCLWIILERPDMHPETEIGPAIRAYNVSVGGVNSDTEGYHETITQTYLCGARAYLARQPDGMGFVDLVNGFLLSPEGRRDFPLQFYTRETLFSVVARRQYVAPDRIGTA